MLRASHRGIGPHALLLTLVLTGVAGVAAAPGHAAPVAGGDTTTLTGKLVTVVDGPAPDSRVQVAGGAFVPVKAEHVRGVAPGSTVAVTVDRRTVDRVDASSERAFTPRPSGTGTSNTGTSNTGTSNTGATVGDATVVSAPVSATVVPSTQQLVVAVVVPRGVTGTAATADQVRTQVAGVDQYWAEQTGGAVHFAVSSVSAPLTLSSACSDYWGMWQEAAGRVGFTPGTDKHLVMVLPRAATSAGCSYGLASIGSTPNAGGYVYVADTAWPVLAHELGHNLGLAHAERLLCSSAADADLSTATSRGCQVTEYGDPWDVMAASAPNNAGSLSSVQGYRTGLMPASAVATVTSGTAAVTLNAVSSLMGTRAVRVVDPTTGTPYFVEYRARSGRDYLLYANMTAGVRVLREDSRTSGAAKPSLALDVSPTGSATDYTWGIGVGGSFTSYTGGVTVKVTGQDASTAQLSVTAGKAATTPAPTPTPTTTTPTTTSGPRTVDLTAATGRVSRLGTGGWYDVKTAQGYYSSTALVTYTYGASWSATVPGGRTFDLIGTAFPGGAPGRIYVDGVSWADFTSYKASWANNYQQLLRRINVPAGTHTVTIVALPNVASGQSTLALDAYRLG